MKKNLNDDTRYMKPWQPDQPNKRSDWVLILGLLALILLLAYVIF